MFSRGLFRAVGASLAALLLVFIGASAVMAAPSCTVTVSPGSGAAGTLFSFHGKGFKPEHLTLRKGGAEAGDHELSDINDPWTLSVRSRPGDEGTWSAEFYNDDCSAVASFKVTLSSTDVADATHTDRGSPLSIPLAALVVVFGAGSGVAVVRRLHNTVDNRIP